MSKEAVRRTGFASAFHPYAIAVVLFLTALATGIMSLWTPLALIAGAAAGLALSGST